MRAALNVSALRLVARELVSSPLCRRCRGGTVPHDLGVTSVSTPFV